MRDKVAEFLGINTYWGISERWWVERGGVPFLFSCKRQLVFLPPREILSFLPDEGGNIKLVFQWLVGDSSLLLIVQPLIEGFPSSVEAVGKGNGL